MRGTLFHFIFPEFAVCFARQFLSCGIYSITLARKFIAMSASFELKKSVDGQFHFSLHAADGASVLRSETYTTLASAKNGIESVRKNAGTDSRYVFEKSANGKTYFNLKAANGQIIGSSPLFSDPHGARQAADTVKHHAATAPLHEA
jgi:uncharacterized protein YegP (UPF0339 family)